MGAMLSVKTKHYEKNKQSFQGDIIRLCNQHNCVGNSNAIGVVNWSRRSILRCGVHDTDNIRVVSIHGRVKT